MRAEQRNKKLHEICALQWQTCVESAGRYLTDLPSEFVYHLKYEDFARQPEEHIAKMVNFIGMQASAEEIESAANKVSSSSIGKGKSTLSEDEVDDINRLVGKSLERYGQVING